MDKLIPNLWFDTEAEEAANFYVAIFPNSKITDITRYTPEVAKAGGGTVGKVVTVAFELNGNPFVALNGGPLFKFSEAVSFIIECEDQAEVDHYWDRLTADGGQPSRCGWLKDRYGLSWQVTPKIIWRTISSGDEEAKRRVMAEVMKMDKLDVATLERAAAG